MPRIIPAVPLHPTQQQKEHSGNSQENDYSNANASLYARAEG